MFKYILLFGLLANAGWAQEDCIFDQNAFNKSWIASRPELKTFVWDENSKSFGIVLGANEFLRVSGGGCYHYGETYRLSVFLDEKAGISDEFYKKTLLRIANLVLAKEILEKAVKQINALQISVPNLMTGKSFVVDAIPYEKFGIVIHKMESQIDFEINWYQN